MGRQWLQKLETFLIVTVISVLVWLYADVQTVRQWTEHVRIQLVPLGDQDLAIEPSVEQEVRVNFRASNQQHQRFLTMVRNPKEEGKALEIPVDAPSRTSPATRQVNVADLLRQSQLNELQLDITSTDPPEMSVRVEPMERLQLPVKILWEGLNLAGEPTTDIKTALVSVPRSMVDAVRSSVLIADLTQAPLDHQTPGVGDTRQITLNLPPEVLTAADDFARLKLTYQPPAVPVTFILQSQNEPYVIKRVKVYKSVLPAIDDKFEITIPSDQPSVVSIEVTGPSDQIELIRQDASKIYADLRPTLEQLQSLEGDTLSLSPQIIGLPPQVYPSSTPQQIQVNVKPRQTNNQ